MDINIETLEKYYQSDIGITEKYFKIKPFDILKISSFYNILNNYEIKEIGKGLEGVEKIIRHICRTKLNAAPNNITKIFDKIWIAETDSFILDSENRFFSETRPENIDKISVNFVKEDGAERIKKINEYAAEIKNEAKFIPPLYITGKCLNFVAGADKTNDYELFMIDGARRLAAFSLNHYRNIKILIIFMEDEISSLLTADFINKIKNIRNKIDWFSNYQYLPMLGFEGERTLLRYEIMNLSLLRNKTVADFGCNTGQACFKAIQSNAAKVFGFDLVDENIQTAETVKNEFNLDNLILKKIDFNDNDFENKINGIYSEQFDYSFFFSIYRTIELKDRDRLFRFIINKTKTGIFFEGHAHPKIDTLEYYDWLFKVFNLKYDFLGYSENKIRPLFYLSLS